MIVCVNTQMCVYVECAVSKAGDVANGDRKVVSAQQLKPDLVEVQHYVLVPEAAWEKLIRWYSLPPSQVSYGSAIITFLV